MKIKLKNIRFVDAPESKPFEYYCYNCKQLRLSLVVTKECANCGSKNIVKGKIGTLRK